MSGVLRLAFFRRLAGLAALAPGLALVAAIALTASALRHLPIFTFFSPAILAIVLGAILKNAFGAPVRAKAGVGFSMRVLLRGAIVLLGLQLTAAQIATVGAHGLAIIAATLTACFLFTVWMGRLLGVERKLVELIAAGTSICGASAVIAVNAATQASDEDVAYAIACVTIFGTLAMFVYPATQVLFGLNAHAFGLWAGASIHEIAQVVGAAFQNGREALEFAVIAKLARVMLLAPVVIALSAAARRRNPAAAQAKPPTPWFVLGFIVLVGVNSIVAIPPAFHDFAAAAATFLLSMALAAMGLATDVAKIRSKGLRPLLLGLLSFLFIGGFGLSLVEFTA